MKTNWLYNLFTRSKSRKKHVRLSDERKGHVVIDKYINGMAAKDIAVKYEIDLSTVYKILQRVSDEQVH